MVRTDGEAAVSGRSCQTTIVAIAAISFFMGCSFSQMLSFGGLPLNANTYDNVRFTTTTTQNDASSPASNAVVDITNVQEAVTVCTPITPEQTAALKSEINDYEKLKKFQDKIEEVLGTGKVAAHHLSIEKYLSDNVLEAGWSILELGCAAGMMLQMVKRAYEKVDSPHRELVGVELVTGWVNFAQSYHKDIKVFEGDITNFNLPVPYVGKTFDFVMLNDVAEHIQKERYGCFFQKLNEVTHEGSLVYMHTPTPQAQLTDEGQFVENVLPHHYLVTGMALAGFELVTFEHDVDTVCSEKGGREFLPRSVREVGCLWNMWPKYYHVIFRKSPKQVLVLS